MNRSEILDLAKKLSRPCEVVSVPALGCDFHVYGMTVAERDEFEASFAGNVANFRPRLLVRTLHDAEGHRVFTADDYAALNALPASVVAPLVEKSLELSGMTAPKAKPA